MLLLRPLILASMENSITAEDIGAEALLSLVLAQNAASD